MIAISSKGEAMAPCGACRELMVQLNPEGYREIEIMLDYQAGTGGEAGRADARLVGMSGGNRRKDTKIGGTTPCKQQLSAVPTAPLPSR